MMGIFGSEDQEKAQRHARPPVTPSFISKRETESPTAYGISPEPADT